MAAGEEEEEASDEEQEDIFELEGMSELDINADPEALERFRQERGGWEGAVAVGSHAAQSDAAGGRAPVDETANKLDSMMDLTFAHLQRRLMEPNGLPLLWDAMLPIFERTILSTHRSKFSQFLIFYICCKHPDPCGRMFVEFLLARLKVGGQGGVYGVCALALQTKCGIRSAATMLPIRTASKQAIHFPYMIRMDHG